MALIYLLQITYSKNHASRLIPHGLLAVGTQLKKNGHDIRILQFSELQIDEVLAELDLAEPLFFGVSTMTGNQTEHSAIFSQKLKERNANALVVWGGIHPSLLPEQCIAEEYIDIVVVGEGEETAPCLADALENKKKLDQVKGIYFKRNGEVVFTGKRPLIEDLSKYPVDMDLINLEDYFDEFSSFFGGTKGEYKRVLSYRASRGCPHSCGFCYNIAFNQRKWRQFPVDQVVGDILHLKEKHKIDAIKFYDDNFFVNKQRAIEILERIKLPFTADIRIDSVDDELAAKLKELGCMHLLLGLESGCDETLELISKGYNVERMLEGIRILARHHLHVTYSIIIGFPKETEEMRRKTLRTILDIKRIHRECGFTLGMYLPYPGSDLYSYASEHGFEAPESTIEWGRCERWAKFNSPWINARYAHLVREAVMLMGMHIPLLNAVLAYRIRHNFFAMPLDIVLIKHLTHLALENKTSLGRFLKRVYVAYRHSKKG